MMALRKKYECGFAESMSDGVAQGSLAAAPPPDVRRGYASQSVRSTLWAAPFVRPLAQVAGKARTEGAAQKLRLSPRRGAAPPHIKRRSRGSKVLCSD